MSILYEYISRKRSIALFLFMHKQRHTPHATRRRFPEITEFLGNVAPSTSHSHSSSLIPSVSSLHFNVPSHKLTGDINFSTERAQIQSDVLTA
jgi:hypothetical protein